MWGHCMLTPGLQMHQQLYGGINGVDALIGVLLQGCRMTVYSRCTHEIFAGYGECARWDGLVERLTRYADDARHAVLEVRLEKLKELKAASSSRTDS